MIMLDSYKIERGELLCKALLFPKDLLVFAIREQLQSVYPHAWLLKDCLPLMTLILSWSSDLRCESEMKRLLPECSLSHHKARPASRSCYILW